MDSLSGLKNPYNIKSLIIRPYPFRYSCSGPSLIRTGKRVYKTIGEREGGCVFSIFGIKCHDGRETLEKYSRD